MLVIKSIVNKSLLETYVSLFRYINFHINFWFRWYQIYYYFKFFNYIYYFKFKIFVLNSGWWANTFSTPRLSNLTVFRKKRRLSRLKSRRRLLLGYRQFKKRCLRVLNFLENYMFLISYKIMRQDNFDELLDFNLSSLIFYLKRSYLSYSKKLKYNWVLPRESILINCNLPYLRYSGECYFPQLTFRLFFKSFIIKRIFFVKLYKRSKFKYKFIPLSAKCRRKFSRTKAFHKKFISRRRYTLQKWRYFLRLKRFKRFRYRSRGVLNMSYGRLLKLRTFFRIFAFLFHVNLKDLIPILLAIKEKKFINRFYKKRRHRIIACRMFYKKKNYYYQIKSKLRQDLNFNIISKSMSPIFRINVNPLKFIYLYFFTYSVKPTSILSLRQRSFVFEKNLTNTIYTYFFKRSKGLIQRTSQSIINFFRRRYLFKRNDNRHKLWSLDLNKSILETLRLSRKAEWLLKKPIKLNRRRYLVYFRKSLKNRPKILHQTVFVFFLIQLFNRLISWHQISLLLELKFFIVNGIALEKFSPELGDIIEFPISLVHNLLGLWSRRNTFKFFSRIKRWSYISYRANTSFHYKKKKNPPKYLKKLPIAKLQPGRSFLIDYSTNIVVYTFTNHLMINENISQLFETTVYKLYPWKFRA